MNKRFTSAASLAIYSMFLINLLVFKNMPVIRIGHMLFNFGGTNADGEANFVPFKTILSYLLGSHGWLIAGLNLIGNIVLLIPIGLLATLVYQDMTWKKALIIAVAAGLLLEGMQVIFNVGIFDVDDVILNAFGVMIGYWIYKKI